MSDKPISLEAIMALSEDEIAETFPLGIVAVATDRWRPAEEGEQPNKELGELVKAKHDRQEQPRLLHRDSTHGYTDFPGRAMPREPEAVDKSTQERFSKEASEHFAITHAEEQTRASMRSVTARLRQHVIAELKAGRDPSGVLRAVEEQLEGERRREAA